MRRILVLFATHHGQTRAVAFRIAETLRARGEHVHLRDVSDEDCDPGAYDAVVAGAPVEMSHHHRALEAWARRHRTALNTRPSAFFSVSMTAATPSDAAKIELERIVGHFLAETGWRPDRVEKIAGAIAYTKYGFVTRLVMRAISKAQGRPTDTHHDHEFTDWEQVDRFAGQLVPLLAAPAAVPPRPHHLAAS